MSTDTIEYRGYTLAAVEHSPGWRVHIYPGPGLLHTRPDHAWRLQKRRRLRRHEQLSTIAFQADGLERSNSGSFATSAAIRRGSSLLSNLGAEHRPRRAAEAMSAVPKSRKPSRPDGSSGLYCLIGDFVSQEIAFVSLIKVFVAIRNLPLFVPVLTKHTSPLLRLVPLPR